MRAQELSIVRQANVGIGLHSAAGDDHTQRKFVERRQNIITTLPFAWRRTKIDENVTREPPAKRFHPRSRRESYTA